MNKKLILDGNINEDLLDKLIEFVNGHDFSTSNIDVYLCSDGGIMSIMGVMEQIFQEHYENIRLFAFDHIYSAAFILFDKFRGQKFLIHDCIGMARPLTNEIRVNSFKVAMRNNEKCHKENLLCYNYYIEDMANRLFTKTQKTLFFNENADVNNDVFFTYNEMKQIFKNGCTI